MHEQLAFAMSVKTLGEDGTFAGYASVFDVVDAQRDVVMRGAFKRSLRERKGQIKLLWQHSLREPVGEIVRIFEDTHGLYVEGRLMLSLSKGREAYVLLKKGIVGGLSIGYAPVKYYTNPKTKIRHLTQVDLFEVSLVTFPANEAARISVVKEQTPLPGQMIALHDALAKAHRVLSAY